MKIIDSIRAWFSQRDIAKMLMIIAVVIIWCLVMIFYFHSSDEMFYRD